MKGDALGVYMGIAVYISWNVPSTVEGGSRYSDLDLSWF